MPAWKVHREIYEEFGISEEVGKDIDALVDKIKKSDTFQSYMEAKRGKEKLTKLSSKEKQLYEALKKVLGDNWKDLHDAPLENPTALYVYLGIVNRLYGEEGVKALLIHYILDYLHRSYTSKKVMINRDINKHRISKVKMEMREFLIKWSKQLKEDIRYARANDRLRKIGSESCEKGLEKAEGQLSDIFRKVESGVFSIALAFSK